jgi:hypothetical protein
MTIRTHLGKVKSPIWTGPRHHSITAWDRRTPSGGELPSMCSIFSCHTFSQTLTHAFSKHKRRKKRYRYDSQAAEPINLNQFSNQFFIIKKKFNFEVSYPLSTPPSNVFDSLPSSNYFFIINNPPYEFGRADIADDVFSLNSSSIIQILFSQLLFGRPFNFTFRIVYGDISYETMNKLSIPHQEILNLSFVPIKYIFSQNLLLMNNVLFSFFNHNLILTFSLKSLLAVQLPKIFNKTISIN